MFGVPLWAALAGLLLFAVVMRNKCMAWAALCLLANWIANTLLANLSGSQFNWLAMGVVDYITAIAIICSPITRWQIIVTGLYALELIAHASFAFTDEGLNAQIKYWWALHYLAWAQALTVAGWGLYDLAESAWHRGRDNRVLRPFRAVLARMGPDQGGQAK